MEIGAQLFTVRDFCTTLEGLEETLKRIATIGYKNVQVSGVCDYDPQWMKETLDRYGLRCIITHIPIDRLKNETEAVVAGHTVMDCRYVGLGYYGFNEKTPADFAEELAAVPSTLMKAGKYFMFHNHAYEFNKEADGTYYLDRLAELFPAEEMGFTLDTYWVSKAGLDPAEWLRRLKGRVPVIHLKDITPDEKMAALGEGTIDFDAVFAAAEYSGVQYMMVEQDDCYGEDPFACLERSYQYLKQKGF